MYMMLYACVWLYVHTCVRVYDYVVHLNTYVRTQIYVYMRMYVFVCMYVTYVSL